VVLRGRVVSGLGDFSFWMEKLEEHYTRKTGMKLFPGTLNVLLDKPWSLPAQCVRLEKEEYGARVSVNLVPCCIFERSAFVLRTDLNESGLGPHPKNLIEIATDVKLRDVYRLCDGDEVEVHLPGVC
jgi:riboflavin kinase, archaea type